MSSGDTVPNADSPLTGEAEERARRERVAARVLASWDREEARRRHMIRAGTTFVLLPLGLLLAWLLLVGYQRHVLELRIGDATVRIVSRHGPYEITTDSDILDRETRGLPGWVVTENLDTHEITPRMYEAAAFASTRQTVTLPEKASGVTFAINDIAFDLAAGELRCGPRRWVVAPGRMVVIDLDRLGR